MATVKEKMLGLMNLPELLGFRSEMQVHNCTVTVYTVDYGLDTGDEKDRRPGGRLAGHSTGWTGGCPLLGQVRQSGKILLGGKCPFVRTKKILRTKKLSGQKNCPDKKTVRTNKVSGQKNCTDKKKFRTKKLYGQKNCPDKIVFVGVVNVLDFFVHPALDLLS